MRAVVGGRRRDMGLGGYPDVPLAAAREAARQARAKIREGIDPIEEARAKRSELKGMRNNSDDNLRFTLHRCDVRIGIHPPHEDLIAQCQQHGADN